MVEQRRFSEKERSSLEELLASQGVKIPSNVNNREQIRSNQNSKQKKDKKRNPKKEGYDLLNDTGDAVRFKVMVGDKVERVKGDEEPEKDKKAKITILKPINGKRLDLSNNDENKIEYKVEGHEGGVEFYVFKDKVFKKGIIWAQSEIWKKDDTKKELVIPKDIIFEAGKKYWIYGLIRHKRTYDAREMELGEDEELEKEESKETKKPELHVVPANRKSPSSNPDKYGREFNEIEQLPGSNYVPFSIYSKNHTRGMAYAYNFRVYYMDEKQSMEMDSARLREWLFRAKGQKNLAGVHIDGPNVGRFVERSDFRQRPRNLSRLVPASKKARVCFVRYKTGQYIPKQLVIMLDVQLLAPKKDSKGKEDLTLGRYTVTTKSAYYIISFKHDTSEIEKVIKKTEKDDKNIKTEKVPFLWAKNRKKILKLIDDVEKLDSKIMAIFPNEYNALLKNERTTRITRIKALKLKLVRKAIKKEEKKYVENNEFKEMTDEQLLNYIEQVIKELEGIFEYLSNKDAPVNPDKVKHSYNRKKNVNPKNTRDNFYQRGGHIPRRVRKRLPPDKREQIEQGMQEYMEKGSREQVSPKEEVEDLIQKYNWEAELARREGRNTATLDRMYDRAVANYESGYFDSAKRTLKNILGRLNSRNGRL